MILMQKIREEKRKSKRQLWIDSSVDTSYITYAETRGFRLYDAQLRKIADALGYKGDPADLLKEVPDEEE